MKVKLSNLAVGTCFLGKKGEVKKKVAEKKVATVRERDGRVLTRKIKADPEVEPSPCELRLLGVGTRLHPDMIVEIGDGNLLKKRKNR